MAVTTARIDMKDIYLYILTHELAPADPPVNIIGSGFKFSDGDFTFRAPRDYEFIPDRGLIESGSVRQNDEQPMEVNFEGEYATLFGEDGVPSAYEILMGEGDAADYAGLGNNVCEPYATWLLVVNDPKIRLPQCSDGEFLLFKNFFCNGPDVAFRAGTVSFDGRCKATAPVKVTYDGMVAMWPNFDPIHDHS